MPPGELQASWDLCWVAYVLPWPGCIFIYASAFITGVYRSCFLEMVCSFPITIMYDTLTFNLKGAFG